MENFDTLVTAGAVGLALFATIILPGLSSIASWYLNHVAGFGRSSQVGTALAVVVVALMAVVESRRTL